MNKTIKRITTLALALVMILALAIPALALNVAETDSNGKELKADMEIPIKLQVGSTVQSAENVKITFTISATADPAESDFAITPGIMDGVTGSIDSAPLTQPELDGEGKLEGTLTIPSSEITAAATSGESILDTLILNLKPLLLTPEPYLSV